VRKVAAGLVLVWLIAGVAFELASYLPVDPEWALFPTITLFGTSFLVGAAGAFFMSPERAQLPKYPRSARLPG